MYTMRDVVARWASKPGLVVVAVIVVAVDLAVAAWHTPLLARIGHQNLTGPRYLVRDADLDPFSIFAPTQAFVLAQQTIPRDATYTVVVGDDPPVASPGVVQSVFRFWLMPRRYTARLSAAQWVIAYHHPSETLGVRYSKEIGLGPDANAVLVTP